MNVHIYIMYILYIHIYYYNIPIIYYLILNNIYMDYIWKV